MSSSDIRGRVGTDKSAAFVPSRPQIPGLVVTACPTATEVGRAVSLDGVPLQVGRGETAGLILDDPGLSRLHLSIERNEDGRFVVIDSGSTNGTYLNGRRVTQAVLADGDRIQLGYSSAVRVVLTEVDERITPIPERTVSMQGMGLWEWVKADGRLSIREHVPGRLIRPGYANWEAVLADDRDAATSALQAALDANQVCDVAFRVVSPDGAERWALLRGGPFRSDDGQPAGLSGVLLDITAQKRAEAQLEQQHHIFESLSEAIIAINREGQVAEWTGRAPTLLGYTRDEMVGRDFAMLLGDVSSPLVDAILAGVAREGRWAGEQVLERRDGREVLVQIRAMPVAGSDARGGLVLLVCSDVGAQREMERQLQLTERLTSLGTLAAGMAHEINNPLSFVTHNLEYLLEQGTLPEEQALAVKSSLEGARRIATIVADLKSLSRGTGQDERLPIDVNGAVQFAARMAEKQVRYRARLDLQLSKVPPVLANETRLGQVLFNLMMNAAQAIPEGAPEQHSVTVAVGHNPQAQQVVVEVRDTGSGIPQDLHARIFEPFFSTRRKAGGTGLGLSICHRIVSDLGGDLVFETQEGKGTTFRVVLPATSARSSVTTQPQLPTTVERRSVLIIDDEPFMLETLHRVLKKDFDVETVMDASEALARLNGGEDPDVILCDLMMPGMSGIDFYEAVTEALPRLVPRLIFMTGGAFTQRAHEFLDEVKPRLLGKPIQSDQLRAAIRETAQRTGAIRLG